jgi:hypothetical protein
MVFALHEGGSPIEGNQNLALVTQNHLMFRQELEVFHSLARPLRSQTSILSRELI